MVDNRQGGERRPFRGGKPGGPGGQQRRGGRPDGPRGSGQFRDRRPRQDQDARPDRDGGDRPEEQGPAIPADVEASQLAPEVRRELSTLSKNTADTIARHLVAAGNLLDDDPEAALAHAVELWRLSGNKPTNWLGIIDWYDQLRADPAWTPQARLKANGHSANGRAPLSPSEQAAAQYAAAKRQLLGGS